MHRLQLMTYNGFLRLYYALMSVVALFNDRAKLWITERKKHPIGDISIDQKRERIWFHCASLGEFDQALPVIERFKNSDAYQIFVSFYSPSGFRYVKDKNEFKELTFFYLPKDYVSQISPLMESIQPKMLFIIKYELWYHLIDQASKRNIPLYLVSAYFFEGQSYFKNMTRNFYVHLLNRFNKIFLLNEHSAAFLEKIGVSTSLIVTGDTRVERCVQHTLTGYSNELVEMFIGNKKMIILGSSWPEEEVLLHEIIPHLNNYRIVIAPHDISENHIEKIEKLFSPACIRYSEWGTRKNKDKNILIIDNIGLLKNLYSYAWLSIIGGGFKGRLHNVLEPVAHGVPVICGSRTKRYPEAEILESIGVLARIEPQSDAFLESIAFFEKEENYVRSKKNAKNYILKNSDAAQMLFDGLNT